MPGGQTLELWVSGGGGLLLLGCPFPQLSTTHCAHTDENKLKDKPTFDHVDQDYQQTQSHN